MAVSSKVEELILELTKNVGNIYDALKYGIGDNDTPGSSIFELNNLETLASTGYPYFGIIESNPLGFGITYDSNDPYYVTLNSGQIAYNGSVLQLISQKIPLKREWISDYSQTAVGSSGYKYGITIGFPISEAQKSTQSWSTVVGSQSSINTNILFLKNVDIAKNLGLSLPFQA